MPNSNVLPDLAMVRNKRGISLAQIAQETKITINYLKAIEACEFEKLPGGVYNVSYVRQYARAIDFDEDDLMDSYYAAVGNRPEMIVPKLETPSRRHKFARLLHLTAMV